MNKFFQGEYRLFLPVIILFYLLIFFIEPAIGYETDTIWWERWGTYTLQNGFGNAYQSGTNYASVSLYLFHFFALIQGSADKIHQNIKYFREVILLFDIASVLFVAYFINKFGISIWKSLFILLNIAFLFNTVIWGQIDTVYTFFGVGSLMFALSKKPVLSVAFMVLAINSKFQAIIFVPVAGLILFPQFIEQKRKIWYSLLAMAVVQFILLLPFILKGQFIPAINAYSAQVGLFPVVTSCACNLWAIIFHAIDPMSVSDSKLFAGLSYKTWGQLLFILSCAIAVLPVFVEFVVKKGKENYSVGNIKMAILSTLLFTLNFYFFNTEMHERYVHPVVLLSGLYCIIEGEYYLFIVLSIAYVLNLERVMNYLQLHNYHTLMMSQAFIGWVFAACIIYAYYKLYSRFSLRKAAV